MLLSVLSALVVVFQHYTIFKMCHLFRTVKIEAFFVLILSTFFILSSCKRHNTAVPDATPTYHTWPGTIGLNDNSTVVSQDNNLIICGNKNDSIVLLKISKTGTLVWRHVFYAGFHSTAAAVAISTGQEIFICGKAYENPNISINDVLLIKADQNGDTLWTKKYGGAKEDLGSQIIATRDGIILICGTPSCPGLIKTEPSGRSCPCQ